MSESGAVAATFGASGGSVVGCDMVGDGADILRALGVSVCCSGADDEAGDEAAAGDSVDVAVVIVCCVCFCRLLSFSTTGLRSRFFECFDFSVLEDVERRCNDGDGTAAEPLGVGCDGMVAGELYRARSSRRSSFIVIGLPCRSFCDLLVSFNDIESCEGLAAVELNFPLLILSFSLGLKQRKFVLLEIKKSAVLSTTYLYQKKKHLPLKIWSLHLQNRIIFE